MEKQNQLPTLEECRELATEQARIKEWNVSTDWLIKKLHEEYNELLTAIIHKRPKEIMKEISDFIIVAVQLKHNEATNYNLDRAFDKKLKDNYKNKKKTWDVKKEMVVRK